MARLSGRAHDLAVLEQALERALAREGGVVVMSGEPGIGKTALARAFGVVAGGRGVPTAWGRGAEDGAPAYWPWRQVLRTLASTPGAAAFRFEAEDDTRLRLFDAFHDLLRAAAEPAGLLVVLDDLHWADLSSVRLLEHIADDPMPSRVLVVVTYRPTEGGAGDVVHDLDGVRTLARLGLRGLPVEAVHDQLVSTSGQPVTAALSEKVCGLTGGNPFFVGELGRLLAEDVHAGTVIGDAWPYDVPTTVRVTIRRRLGRLEPQTRHVLRAAAVAGREFPVAVVAAMVRAPAMTCLDALDEARAAGFVEPIAVPGRQRFVHALVRDALDADLPTSQRARLHRAAADTLEAGVDREVQASAVAGHRAAAELALPADQREPAEALRAADWARRAADEAMRGLAYEEAVRLRRLALDLGGPTLDDLARCELLLGLARALQRSGELAASLDACRQVAELARALDRPDLLADAALVLHGVGDPALSRGLLRLAEDALAALGDGPPATRARLLAQLTEAHLYLGDEQAADAHSRESLAVAELAGDRDTLLVALGARRLAALSPEDADETLTLADRVLSLAGGPGAVRHAFWAHVWRVQAWLIRGRLDLVARELEELAACADDLREPLTAAQLLRFRAVLASARGRFDDALDMAERAQVAFRRSGQSVSAGQHAGFRCSVSRFVGYSPDLADALAVPPDAAGPFAGLGRARHVLALAGLGRRRDAAAEYRRLEPVATSGLPRYLRLTAWSLRLRAAVAVEALSDVAVLVDRLTAYRGLHAGGGVSYDGPVELALGTGLSALGKLDDAEADLAAALASSRAQAASPFVVEVAVELAGVLAQRAGPGEPARAAGLLDEVGRLAGDLGMTPFVTRVQRLRPALGLARSTPTPLSAREAQVAQLVARGMTNREIAGTLVLSERTAENHVQHILTKLGFDNRSQIAAWAVKHLTPG